MRTSGVPSRRDLLRWGLLAAAATPLAACGEGYDDSPDQLARLVDAARRDAESARELAGSGDDDAAKQVAEVRSAHADALQKEVTRANRPAPSRQPAGGEVANLRSLGQRLASAREDARRLLKTAPRHRASLLASVVAGCAGVQVVDKALGKVAEPAFDVPRIDDADEFDEDAVEALQQAIDAEHAAIWAYGLVSAYLPAGYRKGIDAATAEHRERRDGAHDIITAVGATPAIAEPAYALPKKVTGAATAKVAVVAAEADAVAAWRGVVERTDDAGLRTFACDAMQGSSVRGTRWRLDAGESPAAVALP